MSDFKEMLSELNIDVDILNKYIDSEKFKELAGPVVNDNNKNYRVLDSKTHGKGIFSNKDFIKGDLIGYAQLNNTRTLAGRYTNHCKFNNAKFYYIRKNNNSVLIAEKDIFINDEILVNYRHHTYNKEYYE
jgi:SET domain-containing protein